MAKKDSAEKAVREIRRKTRRRFTAEEKIRIVIEGLRGEESIASLCRREGIAVRFREERAEPSGLRVPRVLGCSRPRLWGSARTVAGGANSRTATPRHPSCAAQHPREAGIDRSPAGSCGARLR